MEKRKPTPDEVRLHYTGVVQAIKNGAKPSDIVGLLNSVEDPDYKRVAQDAYEAAASPQLKARVQKVEEANRMLAEFDHPVDPQQ